jgi:C1A family cysteine protease
MDIRKIDQTSYKLNYRKDPSDIRDYAYRTSLSAPSLEDIINTLPQKVDYISKMSPIKNQGRLGSCVGFAVTALKEYQEQKEHSQEVAEGKKNHRDEKYYDLSESWIYWMSKKIDPWPNEEGTSIRCAMKVLKRIGVPTEKAWPYDDKVYGEPKIWANLVARWSLIDSYWRVDNLNELKIALSKSPVVIGIGCYAEIFNVGSDGIIKDPANPQYGYGGHAICAVGYNDFKKLVKFKNSWSTNWGQNGYGYISYNYINQYMWDAWACKDLSVTKEMLKGTRKLIRV